MATIRSVSCLYLAAGVLFTLCAMVASVSVAASEAEPLSNRAPAVDAEIWRAVNEGTKPVVGTTGIPGIASDTPLAEGGRKWRGARQSYLIPIAGWLMAGMLIGIAGFHFLLKRRAEIATGGESIERFDVYERILHWFQALVFIFLGATGLILLLGRFVLLPLIGPEAFAPIASASKEGHNLFGPIFLVALVLFFIRFIARTLPASGDVVWLKKLGGLFTGEHLSAGFMTAAQKLWFWAVMIGGAAICISGLILVFPQFGQSRELMQLAMVVHGVAAVLLIALLFVHVYAGTAGVTGAFKAMNTGKVDAEYARLHHDEWYKECEQHGLINKPQA